MRTLMLLTIALLPLLATDLHARSAPDIQVAVIDGGEGTSGNQNERLDPGERVRLVFNVRNTDPAPLYGAVLELTAEGAQLEHAELAVPETPGHAASVVETRMQVPADADLSSLALRISITAGDGGRWQTYEWQVRNGIFEMRPDASIRWQDQAESVAVEQVIHTHDGGILAGRIIRELDRGLLFRTESGGTLRIAYADIADIEDVSGGVAKADAPDPEPVPRLDQLPEDHAANELERQRLRRQLAALKAEDSNAPLIVASSVALISAYALYIGALVYLASYTEEEEAFGMTVMVISTPTLLLSSVGLIAGIQTKNRRRAEMNNLQNQLGQLAARPPTTGHDLLAGHDGGRLTHRFMVPVLTW